LKFSAINPLAHHATLDGQGREAAADFYNFLNN